MKFAANFTALIKSMVVFLFTIISIMTFTILINPITVVVVVVIAVVRMKFMSAFYPLSVVN